MSEWRSVHRVILEAEAGRLHRQSKLLDRLGLPQLADSVDQKITPLLEQLADPRETDIWNAHILADETKAGT